MCVAAHSAPKTEQLTYGCVWYAATAAWPGKCPRARRDATRVVRAPTRVACPKAEPDRTRSRNACFRVSAALHGAGRCHATPWPVAVGRGAPCVQRGCDGTPRDRAADWHAACRPAAQDGATACMGAWHRMARGSAHARTRAPPPPPSKHVSRMCGVLSPASQATSPSPIAATPPECLALKSDYADRNRIDAVDSVRECARCIARSTGCL